MNHRGPLAEHSDPFCDRHQARARVASETEAAALRVANGIPEHHLCHILTRPDLDLRLGQAR
jgi:hypothetical protein